MGRVLRRLSHPVKVRGFLVGPSRCDAKVFLLHHAFLQICYGHIIGTFCLRRQPTWRNGLSIEIQRQICTMKNLEAKIPAGGGRVTGGTAARAFRRATRSILDAPDDAVKSNRFSSRFPQQIEWLSVKR